MMMGLDFRLASTRDVVRVWGKRLLEARLDSLEDTCYRYFSSCCFVRAFLHLYRQRTVGGCVFCCPVSRAVEGVGLGTAKVSAVGKGGWVYFVRHETRLDYKLQSLSFRFAWEWREAFGENFGLEYLFIHCRFMEKNNPLLNTLLIREIKKGRGGNPYSDWPSMYLINMCKKGR